MDSGKSLVLNTQEFDKSTKDLIDRVEKIRSNTKAVKKNEPNTQLVIVGNENSLADSLKITKIAYRGTQFKCDIMTMDAPIFGLKKKGDTEIFTWFSGNGLNQLTVIPSAKGRATMWNKDIWIYVITCLIDMVNQGLLITKTVQFHIHNYLKATSKGTSGKHYDEVLSGLGLLHGTVIKSNMITSEGERVKSVHLIEGYVYEKSNKNRSFDRAEVTIPDWLFKAILAKQVLTIDSGYFKLTSSIEKRLYEIPRKQMGKNKASWYIGFDLLKARVGSTSKDDTFMDKLKDLIKTDRIPDYRFKPDGNYVHFYSKNMKLLADALVNKQ